MSDSDSESMPPQPKEEDEFTIYSTQWCGPCKTLKKFMKDNNLEYVAFDLGGADHTGDVIDEFKPITNNNEKILMVFHKGKFIGNASKSMKYIKDNVLEKTD